MSEGRTKKKKVHSRWQKGNERYPKDDLQFIYQHFREADGWYHGAKVYKK